MFDAPWQRRVFGLTMALCRGGTLDWETFRQQLIRRIGNDAQRPYWESWAAAFEDALSCAAVLTGSELDARHQELLQRPPGHDHR